ncbi:MAG: ATP-binding protein [Candidatus Omnitrophota bacterium]
MNLNIYVWGGLVTAFTNLMISSFVYFKNRRSPINKIFPLYSLSIGLWSFCWSKTITATDAAIALHWSKALSIGSILIPAFFLHFIFTILNIVKNKKNILIGSYILAFVFLFFCYFTNLFIRGVAPIFSFNYHIQPGPIYIFHFLSFIAMTIYGAFELFKASKISVGLKRNQIRYLFWALMIGYVGGVTAFFPIYKIPMPPLAVYTIPVCIIVIAYAIVKYSLMEITVTITRTGIFVALYTLVLGLPFLLGAWNEDWLIEFLGPNWWLGPLALMAILATAGPFIYIFLEKRAEAILLREQRKYQETLKQAAREIARIRNLKRLLNLIVHIVTKAVRISHSAIYLYDDISREFILRASRNLEKRQIASLSNKNPLILWIERQKEPLVYEEINRKTQNGYSYIFKEIEQQMLSLNASLIVPGFLKDKLLGFLILGNKRSGGFYTSEDLNTFSVLANQTALAVENALLYENIEDQVRQRTRELVEMQKQLIQAEKMATVGTLAGGVAHEINNPLTAILTNVQMLLTINGSLDVDSKESLDLIEEATKRCRTIVQKLMTYAKKPLETAEINEVNLSKVIKNMISFLEYQLGQDNIKVIVAAEKGDYLVMGNQNELEQVITNMLLNARDAVRQIKKGGTVNISLSKSGDWIKIEIKDEGIGIPPETIPKIFDPFFTTKEVGKGTGLGLSICQSIVEKHNGIISVRSEPDKGSVFTVQLPRIKEKSTLKSKVKV